MEPPARKPKRRILRRAHHRVSAKAHNAGTSEPVDPELELLEQMGFMGHHVRRRFEEICTCLGPGHAPFCSHVNPKELHSSDFDWKKKDDRWQEVEELIRGASPKESACLSDGSPPAPSPREQSPKALWKWNGVVVEPPLPVTTPAKLEQCQDGLAPPSPAASQYSSQAEVRTVLGASSTTPGLQLTAAFPEDAEETAPTSPTSSATRAAPEEPLSGSQAGLRQRSASVSSTYSTYSTYSNTQSPRGIRRGVEELASQAPDERDKLVDPLQPNASWVSLVPSPSQRVYSKGRRRFRRMGKGGKGLALGGTHRKKLPDPEMDFRSLVNEHAGRGSIAYCSTIKKEEDRPSRPMPSSVPVPFQSHYSEVLPRPESQPPPGVGFTAPSYHGAKHTISHQPQIQGVKRKLRLRTQTHEQEQAKKEQGGGQEELAGSTDGDDGGPEYADFMRAQNRHKGCEACSPRRDQGGEDGIQGAAPRRRRRPASALAFHLYVGKGWKNSGSEGGNQPHLLGPPIASKWGDTRSQGKRFHNLESFIGRDPESGTLAYSLLHDKSQWDVLTKAGKRQVEIKENLRRDNFLKDVDNVQSRTTTLREELAGAYRSLSATS